MTARQVRVWARQQFLGRILGFLQPLIYAAAYLWRRLLFRTTFIAITGSLGKTTAKECLADVLAAQFPTARSYRNQNAGFVVYLNLLRVRPWHRFAVIELATDKPGCLARMARLVHPDVAVIIGVARTHTKNYRSLEDTAAEKARLLEGLRPGGLAVLNGDDARVSAMAGKGRLRSRRFGTTPSCDLWVDQVSARWPQRLSFRAHLGSESLPVETQMVGAHLLPSVLAALATATGCGLSLEEAARAIRRAEPFPGRMQPVSIPSGAIFLRDEYNGSQDSLLPALRVLEEATAARRVLVAADFSDCSWKPRKRLSELGRDAARVAELAIFIGERASHACKAAVAAGMPPENVREFSTLEETAGFLRGELSSGDLVLLRGRHCDQLSRLMFAQLGQVKCWKALCYKGMMCDICWELGTPPRDLRKAVLVKPPGWA